MLYTEVEFANNQQFKRLGSCQLTYRRSFCSGFGSLLDRTDHCENQFTCLTVVSLRIVLA